MLTENEIERLRQAIIATIASPVIGSIEDYTWEAIFHYAKNVPLLCHRETQSPYGLGGIGALADGVQRPGSKQ